MVKGCSGDERNLADSIAVAVTKKEPEKIMEGKEPAAFWEALGGKTEYASSKWLAEVLPSHPPRLFQCSNATGKIRVEEIFDFAQEVHIPCHSSKIFHSTLHVCVCALVL